VTVRTEPDGVSSGILSAIRQPHGVVDLKKGLPSWDGERRGLFATLINASGSTQDVSDELRAAIVLRGRCGSCGGRPARHHCLLECVWVFLRGLPHRRIDLIFDILGPVQVSCTIEVKHDRLTVIPVCVWCALKTLALVPELASESELRSLRLEAFEEEKPSSVEQVSRMALLPPSKTMSPS
jgi:hypothetical protein